MEDIPNRERKRQERKPRVFTDRHIKSPKPRKDAIAMVEEVDEFKLRDAMSNTLSLIEDSFKNRHIGIEVVAKDDPSIHGIHQTGN